MPNFVSGSSGYSYSQKDPIQEDEISRSAIDISSSVKKPSAINRKGQREQQKSSLDLFKEELRRLNEQRVIQRNKLKTNALDGGSQTTAHQIPQQSPKTQTSVCVPLKPDPRCPTTLTLQVNLNPKDKDQSTSGSFDTGDPTTTNLYLGNLNPSVNENDLCDIFGKFGPLASIKIMWPRTDEEKARNRNSGFVAYMSRIDAERALRTLNGMDIRGYDLKLGWGKAVPLPQNPVFVPPDLVKLLEPPPQTGLPFNGQLHESDLRRRYKVPNPRPRPPSCGLESQLNTNPELEALKESYNEFLEVVQRSTVRVVIPQDRTLLDRIHRTIEYVLREGPVFEAIIIARENKNSDYKFLYDNQSYEHVYYRWKLYSLLHGDDPYKWQTEEFRMFYQGPVWKPPPLNPFADGMPVELIEKSTGVKREILMNDGSVIHSSRKVVGLDVQSTVRLHLNLSDTRQKGSLGSIKRPIFETMLKEINPTKSSVGSVMMFCINHSDAAQEVVDCICASIEQQGLALARKVGLVFLVSDILHNCSAAVTNASFYRKGFQIKLKSIFENLRRYLIEMINMTHQGTETNAALAQERSDQFKHKILNVLGAWREWTLYEDEFIIELSNILLNINSSTQAVVEQQLVPTENKAAEQISPLVAAKVETEPDLDGEQLDEQILIKCLEEKGLSLRWYKTLELSEDESDDEQRDQDVARAASSATPPSSSATGGSKDHQSAPVKFKTSKWETVDPDKVAEQVIRLSKWQAIEDARQEQQEQHVGDSPGQRSGSSTSFEGEELYYDQQALKRSLSRDDPDCAKRARQQRESFSSSDSSRS